jgi:hypothetical protein
MGADGAGIRTERADLFQDLQEPGAGDGTGHRYRGSHARIGQVTWILPGNDLRRLPRWGSLENGNPEILLFSMLRLFRFLPTARKQEFLQSATEAA